MNIVVLMGGLSPERDVSLTSGSLIANALIRKGHRVCLLDVYLGTNLSEKGMDECFVTTEYPIYSVSEQVPDLEAIKAQSGNGEAKIGPFVIPICKCADVVFLALHGDMGENGQLQATLDSFGIRYTGSGYIGSLLAMDKDLAKKMLVGASVPTPAWVLVDLAHELPTDVPAEVGYPCVVKPCSGGSSVGVSMVDNAEQLADALQAAAKYERYVLVEKRIIGRELTVGIVDGEVLPAIEIIPKEGFYDYANKYQGGKTLEICPAPIDDVTRDTAAELTRRAFDALRLGGYARFDWMLDEAGGLWCLEANTLPGMTPTSLLPQMAAAVGIDYDSLCEKLTLLALK
ncbi:MAG: D-alanine--D-alanine ligase [Clostridia bacterium]|nr:D-alanine--D-alanine ligase [Clostridia bacterium]